MPFDRNSRRSRSDVSATSDYKVNEQIREREVRLITETGENVGVISKTEALDRADRAGLDLVLINESSSPPVAKIMDFGKFLYEKKKKLGEAKKHQKIVQIKEIKMRPNIGNVDYLVKLRRALEFLQEGKKVKFTLQFRGRHKAMMKELGEPFFKRISNDLGEANIGNIIEEKESRSGSMWSKIVSLKT